MKSLGDYYEDQALSLITEAGPQLPERNFSGKTGEIDLIASEGA